MLQRAYQFARERIVKNWPAVRCATGGGMNRFVLAPRPLSLADAVPVFCYHVVSADALTSDLEFLKRNHYVTITADALVDHMLGVRRAPSRAVVLSFDDGSANLHGVVYPLLQAYDMRAVAFVCPGLHADQPSTREPATADNDWATDLCTWSQLRQMHASGHVDVQSHTLEHRHLRHWPEPVVLRGCSAHVQQTRLRSTALSIKDDLTLARQLLEQNLNKTVRHLAFPRMAFDATALRAARACGYIGCWGSVTPSRSDNKPGDPTTAIARLNADMLYRLPGKGRKTLAGLTYKRLRAESRDRAKATV